MDLTHLEDSAFILATAFTRNASRAAAIPSSCLPMPPLDLTGRLWFGWW
jgi:hypothetical protein